MLILTTMLQMVGYWVLFGIIVAISMFLMYSIAWVSGELAEWLKQQFAKLSLRK